LENPLLDLVSPPPFDLIRAEHVEPAIREQLAHAAAKLDLVEHDASPPDYASTLGALEQATESLETAMGLVEHLESTATTPALRSAYNAVLPDYTAFFANVPLRAELFARLLAFSDTEEAKRLDATRARFLDKKLAEFRREGARLAPADKERLSALDRELAQLTSKFSQNVLDETSAFELVLEDDRRLAGMPHSAIELARETALAAGKSGYRLTLHAPSVNAVLLYADDRSLRESMWRAFNGVATSGERDNRPLLGRILELRREKARLLGFAHFADFVTDDRMAKTGAEAQRFVDDLTARTQAAFERERQELFEFRRGLEGPDAPELAPWDVGYYSEKLKRERYAFDDEALRPYFPFESVLGGAFRLAERLFGVRIAPAEGVSVWHDSVRAFYLDDEKGARLGLFYVDPYPRDSKRPGAWMHGLVAAVPPAQNLAVFCANVMPPVGGKPSLLTHRDVETIFHEFGHLLHHMLSTVSVRSLAGTRVVQDFVELPSQIMENWCTEREGLNLFARHFETSARIPDALLERLRAARTFRAASQQMRQLGFAAVDLALHMRFDPERDQDPIAYGNAILQRYASATLPPDYGMLASFGHLFSHPVGYAAGYYSYKWAEVLDADAFDRFRREGMLNPAVGADFRDRVLSRGDSSDPMDLFVSFVGRRPQVDALLTRQGLVTAAGDPG
jgi:oligopeptidase A